MIKVTAPTRISLFGGGTDVDPYCRLYGGETISIAISLRQEYILEGNSSESFFPAQFGGLGSSAAFFLCFLAAQKTANQLPVTDDLPLEAWKLEHEIIGKYTGKQDHYASYYGGCNHFVFEPGLVTMEHIKATFLEKHLLLFDTNIRRQKNIQKDTSLLSVARRQRLDAMKSITHDALPALKEKDAEKVGSLLHSQWNLKRHMSQDISTKEIDDIYDTATKNGAWGGKLMGSGGGGHMIFMLPSRSREFVQEMEKKGLTHIPFSIDTEGLVVES